jgi:ADP-ribose pyrophosphatase YjhB (NUDIX family)
VLRQGREKNLATLMRAEPPPQAMAERISLPAGVQEELDAFPRARLVRRSRKVSHPAFESAARRVRKGIGYGVACRIEDARRRILLVHMAPARGWGDVWVTPGGGAEPGETPRESIVREIREETGGSVHHLSLWKVFDEEVRAPGGDSLRWAFLAYVALWGGGVPCAEDPAEISEAKFFRRLPRNTEFRDDWLRAPRPRSLR